MHYVLSIIIKFIEVVNFKNIWKAYYPDLRIDLEEHNTLGSQYHKCGIETYLPPLCICKAQRIVFWKSDIKVHGSLPGRILPLFRLCPIIFQAGHPYQNYIPDRGRDVRGHLMHFRKKEMTQPNSYIQLVSTWTKTQFNIR